jgi:hypothetical protein
MSKVTRMKRPNGNRRVTFYIYRVLYEVYGPTGGELYT